MIKHDVVFDSPVSHDLVYLTLRDSKVKEYADCFFRLSLEIFVHPHYCTLFYNLKFMS
jgi:hypothetical protein